MREGINQADMGLLIEEGKLDFRVALMLGN
jgi:hypothetical protein